MTIALDIITGAFNRSGLYAIGETIDATTANQGLSVFNQMLDSWGAEVTPLFNIVDSQSGAPTPGFTLNPGTALYTLSAVDLLGVRPVAIADIYLTDANNVSYYQRIIVESEFARLIYKVAPGRPDRVYVNYQATTVTLTFFTTPAYADQVHVMYYEALPNLASVSTAITMPPGYRKAYECCLALELCDYFGKQASPRLSTMADFSKRILNAGKDNLYMLQSPLPTQKRRFFNILTGETV